MLLCLAHISHLHLIILQYPKQKSYRLFSKLDDPEITALLDLRKEGIFYSWEESELKSIRFICVSVDVPGVEKSSQEGSEKRSKTTPNIEGEKEKIISKIGEGASSPRKGCEEMMGFIYLSLTTKNLQKSVLQLMVFSIVFTLVLLTLGIIVAYRFGSEITSPILELADNVRQIASGNMDVKIQSQSRNEIGNLITDVEIMRQSIMKADRLKEEFLSNLSHELKTPLTVVYGYAELLYDADESDFDTLKSYSKEIYENSGILMDYINDLILIADIESQPKLTVGEIKLDEVVKRSLDKFSSLIDEKGIKTKSYLEKHVTISADENYMQKVVDNIIKNAVIFNVQNGEISISALESDDKIRLVIDDTGTGIPEENIHRIWEKFYRIESSLTYEVGGVGIGLFLARRIVELHGGTIYAESEIGKGSRFTIVFPIPNKGSRGAGEEGINK